MIKIQEDIVKNVFDKIQLVLAGLLLIPAAIASPIDDINAKDSGSTFTYTLDLLTPMRVSSQNNDDFGRSFEIQLSPENLVSGISLEDISDRKSFPVNQGNWNPLREVIYDGQDSNFPFVLLRFDGQVKLNAKSSADMMSIIIEVDISRLKRPEDKPEPASGGDLLNEFDIKTIEQEQLVGELRKYINTKDYPLALNVLNKIFRDSTGSNQSLAKELIGVVRELNGQLAHAKAEYEAYLQSFPNAQNSARVKQRLATMLEKAAPRKETPQTNVEKNSTRARPSFYGSFGQRLYRAHNSFDGSNDETVVDQLNTDLALVHKVDTENWSIKTQFSGSHRKDNLDPDGTEFRPSNVYIQMDQKALGIYAKVGRQTLGRAGVYSRFDGVHTSYNINENMVVNAVYGHPIDINDRASINTDISFYGTSIDFLDVGGWNLSSYLINQEILGLTDRQAVGAEARYVDNTHSYYANIDYDTYFSELNSARFLGNWRVNDKTRLSFTTDYRFTPMLTKYNAIIGQGVLSFADLFIDYTDSDLKQMALDRSARLTTVSGSISHTLNKQWQIIGDISSMKLDGTVSSAGVIAIPSTGNDAYYSLQIIGNQLLSDNDIAMVNIRYNDSASSKGYSVNGSWRFNLGNALRINPRLRYDDRSNNNDSGGRTLLRPSLRLEYRVGKWGIIDAEFGQDTYKENTVIGAFKNQTNFFNIGYRIQF